MCPLTAPSTARCLGVFFDATATPEIYTLSLHDALPISGFYELDAAPAGNGRVQLRVQGQVGKDAYSMTRSEEHTSELQSLRHLVCRLLLEKKNGGGGWVSWTLSAGRWRRRLGQRRDSKR